MRTLHLHDEDLSAMRDAIERAQDALDRGRKMDAKTLWPECAEGDLLLADLQCVAAKLELSPVGPLLDQIAAYAGRLGRERGKDVDVSLSGSDLDVPHEARDVLSECLLHAVRNSLTHGIRTKGRIEISCRIRLDELLVTVEDDGAGPDVESIRETARKRGGPVPLGAAEAFEMLFEPGFSTSEATDLVSGRGFGLDAVREEMRRIGGDARVEAARGFRLALSLPLRAVALRAIPALRAGETFWLAAGGFESEPIEASSGSREDGFARHLGLSDSEKALFRARFEGGTGEAGFEAFGPAEKRLFRAVPEAWASRADLLIGRWRALGGPVMATRAAGGRLQPLLTVEGLSRLLGSGFPAS